MQDFFHQFYSFCGGKTSDTTFRPSLDTKSLHWNQTDDIVIHLRAHLLGSQVFLYCFPKLVIVVISDLELFKAIFSIPHYRHARQLLFAKIYFSGIAEISGFANEGSILGSTFGEPQTANV